MAKKRAAKGGKRGRDGYPKAVRSAGRTNTIKSNGGLPESQAVAPTTEPERVTVGEAMRRAVEALGPPTVDDQLASQQLRDLAVDVEEVAKRKAAYEARQEEAKTAKQSLDKARELLEEKLRMYTHAKPLPLFDQKEREADQTAMLDAAEQGGEVIDAEVPDDDALDEASVDAEAPGF